MKSNYDRHQLKILARGVSIEKVIAAYRHFGSLRKTAAVCGISKDTVAEVLRRQGISQVPAALPKRPSYSPISHYSDFALWHKEHAGDEGLPQSVSGLAKLSGVNANIVKCYFYRRRQEARKILKALPDLRKLSITLEDIEGLEFSTKELRSYRFAIDRYSQKGALQGELKGVGEVTVLIPSIETFASRIGKLISP